MHMRDERCLWGERHHKYTSLSSKAKAGKMVNMFKYPLLVHSPLVPFRATATPLRVDVFRFGCS